jgi:hypothetical protein
MHGAIGILDLVVIAELVWAGVAAGTFLSPCLLLGVCGLGESGAGKDLVGHLPNLRSSVCLRLMSALSIRKRMSCSFAYSMVSRGN